MIDSGYFRWKTASVHGELGRSVLFQSDWDWKTEEHELMIDSVCFAPQFPKVSSTNVAAKLSHVSHSWKRAGVVISFMCARKGGYEDLTKEILRHFEAYGFLNPVIIQCDKEMSIIDKRENSVTICAKNKSSEQRVCRSSTRTHTGTRTMLLDTN